MEEFMAAVEMVYKAEDFADAVEAIKHPTLRQVLAVLLKAKGALQEALLGEVSASKLFEALVGEVTAVKLGVSRVAKPNHPTEWEALEDSVKSKLSKIV